MCSNPPKLPSSLPLSAVIPLSVRSSVPSLPTQSQCSEARGKEDRVEVCAMCQGRGQKGFDFKERGVDLWSVSGVGGCGDRATGCRSGRGMCSRGGAVAGAWEGPELTEEGHRDSKDTSPGGGRSPGCAARGGLRYWGQWRKEGSGEAARASVSYFPYLICASVQEPS